MHPKFLSAEILPDNIKKLYAKQYKEFLKNFADIDENKDYNTSNPENVRAVIKEQANLCLSILDTPQPDNSEKLLEEFVTHCKKWDQVYNYNARKLYPEFAEILDRYGY